MSDQEQCLICSSESWSSALRARLQAGLDRRSIANLVHWCRGVYLIYYCGAKQLVLSIPDEANREAVLQNLDGSGHIEVQGHQYEVLSEGPLSHLPQLTSRSEERSAEEDSGQAASLQRGAAWVLAAVSRGQLEESSRPRASRLYSALADIQLPVDVTLQRVGNDALDASDDSIRAVNLSNRISSEDLPTAVQAGMRAALRAARLSGGLPRFVMEHYLGGPCAASQCHVFLPVGPPDGVMPPLPPGFKSLGDLNIAVGTDLVAALRALGSVRDLSSMDSQEDGRPRKARRLDEPLESCNDVEPTSVSEACGSSCVRDSDEEDPTAHEPEQSDDGSDFWGGHPGELAATPPPDDSSEDDSDAVPAFDSADMVVGMAAEYILRGAREHAEENWQESMRPVSEQPEHGSLPTWRPLKVFWGEARWQRTQLLGELARGDWGLCHAKPGDLREPAQALWPQLIRDQRPIVAPQSEMTRAETADAVERERLLELHLQARRRAAQPAQLEQPGPGPE